MHLWNQVSKPRHAPSRVSPASPRQNRSGPDKLCSGRTLCCFAMVRWTSRHFLVKLVVGGSEVGWRNLTESRTARKVGAGSPKSLIPTTVALTRSPLAGSRPAVACKYLAASRLPRSTTRRPRVQRLLMFWLLRAQLPSLGLAGFAKRQSLKQRDNRMFVLHFRWVTNLPPTFHQRPTCCVYTDNLSFPLNYCQQAAEENCQLVVSLLYCQFFSKCISVSVIVTCCSFQGHVRLQEMTWINLQWVTELVTPGNLQEIIDAHKVWNVKGSNGIWLLAVERHRK